MHVYRRVEDALAEKLAAVPPGDQVVLHATECASRGAASDADAERRCDCVPLTLTVGARS